MVKKIIHLIIKVIKKVIEKILYSLLKEIYGNFSEVIEETILLIEVSNNLKGIHDYFLFLEKN